MIHRLSRTALTVLSAATLLVAAPSVAQSIVVKGADGAVHTLDAARLAALPRAQVALSVHGEDHAFEGPTLMDVLRAAGVGPDGPPRGPGLAQAVVVRAADGYAVVFGIGELDPATRADLIILADRDRGEPIGPESGPFRLAAQNDLRPARSARQVTEIEVVSLASGTGRPDEAHAH